MFVGLVCKHTGASCVDARIARGRSRPLAAAHNRCRSSHARSPRLPLAARSSLPLAARSLAAARRPLARRSLPLAARSSLPLARCHSPPSCRGAAMHWAARTLLCALHAHVGMPNTRPDCCAALRCGVSAEAGWWSRGRRVCVPARAGAICGGSRRVRSSRAVQWLMREGQEYISPMHWERERDTAGRHSGERGVLGGRLVWRWRGWMQAER
jgi:hypothetical protein